MELKTYSVIINWNDRDDEEGTYGATVRAPDGEEAEAIARAMMRATGEGSWPFGTCVECSEGAAWAAADLEKALVTVAGKISALHDADSDDAEMHIIADMEQTVSAALKRCEPDGPAWGSLHYDGDAEPDWTKLASLEIDGAAHEDGDDECIRGGLSDHDAEFWTIYGREKDTGLAQAIQDCVSRREADYVLALMMQQSGLPGYRVGEPMPGAIRSFRFPADRFVSSLRIAVGGINELVAGWQRAVAAGETTLGFEEWQRSAAT